MVQTKSVQTNECIISVIIPCYNQGKYIDEAVDSVLNQTFNNFEIIIINDGSTDSYTINKLKNYNRPCCTVIHTENKGLSGARNVGLHNAKGNYIQFLDADDVLARNKFELQLSKLVPASECSLCYCDYFTSIEDDLTVPYPSRYMTPEFKSVNYLHELITDWQTKLTIPCHAFLFKRSMFIDNNICFDEALPNHEDWECWMNIFALNPEVCFINEKLITYRIHEKAMCADTGLMKEGFLNAILKQKIKHKDHPEEYSLLTKRYNQIRFGYPSVNGFAAFIFGSLSKSTRKVNKLAMFVRKISRT